MRNTLAPLALAAALLPAAAAAETKIGYVDFQRAIAEVEEGKSASASLKRELAEKQALLNKEKAELDRMQADIEKQASLMTEEARRERLLEFDRRNREAAMKLQQFQKELSDREGELSRTMFDRLVAITREIAEAEGFTMVFEKNNAGLVHAPPALDLTNELVRKYNARHKPTADAAPAPAKKADKKEKAEKAEKKTAEKPAEKKPAAAK